VVHGSLGEDEISLAGSTRITRLDQGDVATFDLTPEEAGLERAPLEAIRGGSAEENAGLIRAILSGEKGPRRDMALLNAAGALVAAGRARDFREGVQKAAQAVDSGAARTRLNLLVEYSRDMAGSARVAG
jgi:anthranilate phosphoribosyltransferase